MPALLTDAQVSHYVIVVQMNVRTGAHFFIFADFYFHLCRFTFSGFVWKLIEMPIESLNRTLDLDEWNIYVKKLCVTPEIHCLVC